MNRKSSLNQLFQDKYDLLVVGGGATGAGIALDASLRGYKIALIDGGDFSSGASSKSTKLLHGGIRYLEQAFRRMDWRQLKLVHDSLQERGTLMRIAPHLTTSVSIVLPAFSTLRKYYYWMGLKIYEALSGKQKLGASKLLCNEEIAERLPSIRQDGLAGGIEYEDGQFDDARLNIALIQTAVQNGSIALNYVHLDSFIRERGGLCGAYVHDVISGLSGTVKATVVVNATGCFADSVRQLDQPDALPLLSPSRGSHIVVKFANLPIQSGMIIPSTIDKRVIFCLPWQDEVLIGTTDLPSPAMRDPEPTHDEIDYLLHNINSYFAVKLERNDIAASWTGIRPLYSSRKGAPTPQLSRDHYVERSPSGLYSIVGGKWTTYRLMAKDLVDAVIKDGQLPLRNPCTTHGVVLAGGEDYHPLLWQEIKEKTGCPEDSAKHLAHTYGSRAWKVLQGCHGGAFEKLHKDFPFLEAEVVYLLHNEYALTAEDVLFRRLRLGFLDNQAAHFAKRRVDEIIRVC